MTSPCTTCGGLPDDVTANTGRQDYLPDAYDRLQKLSDDFNERLHRCPECRQLYHWIDLPQTYGSGNCDEERLVRLPRPVSDLLDRLYPPEPAKAEGVDAASAEEVAAGVPHDLLLVALKDHVFTAPRLLEPFLPRLIRTLFEEGKGSRLSDLLSNYGYGSRARNQQLLDLIGPRDEAKLAFTPQHLLERLRTRYR